MYKGFTLFLNFISILTIVAPVKAQSHTSDIDFKAFYDVTDTLSVENIRHKLSDSIQYFKPVYHFYRKGSYWLYLPSENNDRQLVLTFRKKVARIEVYPFPFDTISAYGGIMVNSRLKALPGSDVPLNSDHRAFLVKVQVRTQSSISANQIALVSSAQFQQQ
ncbi:MAG TPA: hypothetical protein VHO90_21800, partial [Bacteroidales bacterium]|nr:hypothetical protein [Bacteroidales bacterium]